MIHVAPSVTPVLEALRLHGAGKKLARSLASTRFVDFPNDRQDKDWRRRTSRAIRDGASLPSAKLPVWRSFALALAGSADSGNILFARQEGRLLINLAGGVFENGGIALDRVSGVPFIPGSAVKGCARRTAIAALHEWVSGELDPSDDTNLLSPAVGETADVDEMLFQICLVFGWGDMEWKGREDYRDEQEWQKKRSDFAWACGAHWADMRSRVSSRLCIRLGIDPKDPTSPWKSLPLFAGSVSFLPAYPWEGNPKIDLDVVTCHHGEYYKGNESFADAPDTEEPVPVIFPAIAPGLIWVFLVSSGSRAEVGQSGLARSWLATGLNSFGIGAKTAAGYGWFDTSEGVGAEVRGKIQNDLKNSKALAERRSAEEKQKKEQEARQREREAKASATKDMSPDEVADWEVGQFSQEQFVAKLKSFFKEPKKGGPSDFEKAAIVRALKGPRFTIWQDFKGKAAKGGELAKSEQAIRALNKQINGDKMP
jgi:CRISPR-associated protein Cmr6